MAVEKDLGKVTAYAYAKAAGYTGTEEQFQQVFNEFTENAPGLLDRLDDAVADAEAAQAAAQTAVTNANTAKNAAEAAQAAAEQTAQDMDDSVQQITTNKNDISVLKESINDVNERVLYSTSDVSTAFPNAVIGQIVNSSGRYANNSNGVISNVGNKTVYLYKGSTFKANTGFKLSYAFWKIPVTSTSPTSEKIKHERNIAAGTIITVPQDCYVLVSVMKDDESAFDPSLTAIEIFSAALTINVYYNTVKEKLNQVDELNTFIINNAASADTITNALIFGKNIANNNNYIPYKRINTDGSIVDSDNYNLSQYFLIKPNTTYINRTSATVIAFYDYNKKYIKRIAIGANDVFTTPSNAIYARLSTNSNVQRWQINEGETLLDFSSYEPPKLSEDVIASTPSPYYKGKFSISKPDVHDWYECECLKTNPNAFNFSLGTDTAYTGTQYADMIALYDQLMSDAESGYITKTSIGVGSGTDINGNPYTLYEYAFVPTVHTANNVTKKHPKILIDCCIHGFEKVCAFATFSLLYDVVHNWTKNSFLATLRNFVEIRVVPVVDAWGFDNNVRNNANNVNLNRNFPDENWESGSDINYGGEEPLDQPETAAIASWLDANQDMFMYFNLHVSGHYYSVGFVDANQNMPYSGITEDEYYLRMYNALSRHIERQSAYLPTEFNTALPLPYGSKIGGILPSTHIGTANQYVCGYKKMALAMTLEGFNMLKDSEETFSITIPTGAVKINAEMIANVLEEILYEYLES